MTNAARGSESLTNEEVFTVLSSDRRRWTIEHLRRQPDRSADKQELATRIAARESGKPADEITSKERKRVYIALHQTHLPKMEGLGLLTVDDGEVTLTDRIRQLEPHLGEPSRASPTPLLSAFNVAFGVVAVALLFAAELGPLAAVPLFPFALAVVATFTAAGVVQLYTRYRSGDISVLSGAETG